MRLNMKRFAQTMGLAGASIAAISSQMFSHEVEAQNKQSAGTTVVIGGVPGCDCTKPTTQCYCITS